MANARADLSQLVTDTESNWRNSPEEGALLEPQEKTLEPFRRGRLRTWEDDADDPDFPFKHQSGEEERELRKKKTKVVRVGKPT